MRIQTIMKLLSSITLLLIFSDTLHGFSISPRGYDLDGYTDKVLTLLARSLSEFAAHKLRNSKGPAFVSSDVNPLVGGGATLIPPIVDDPLALPSLYADDINVKLFGDLISVKGRMNLTNPQVSGLTELTDKFLWDYNMVGDSTIAIDLELPLTELISPYQLDALVEVLPESSYHLQGDGNLSAGASDLFLKFYAKGKVPVFGFMSLTELNMDIGFQNVHCSFNDLLLDGFPNDLKFFCGLMQSIFELIWSDSNKVIVNEMIRCAIDDLVSTCKLEAIIGGNLTCLEKPVKLECFTTTPPEPSNVPTESTTKPVTDSTSSPTTAITTTLPETSTTEKPKPDCPQPNPLIDIDIDIDIVINNYPA